METALIALLVLAIAWGMKTKLDLFVAGMWMAENELEPPDKEGVERLAKSFVRHLIHKGQND